MYLPTNMKNGGLKFTSIRIKDYIRKVGLIGYRELTTGDGVLVFMELL